MTPIDNALLSEMLDNALYDIKLLRQEVSHLRDQRDEERDLREGLAEEAAERFEENRILRKRINDLKVEAVRSEWATKDAQAEAARLHSAAEWTKADIGDLEMEVARYKKEAAEARREIDDLVEQLSLYRENCECSQ